MIDNACISDFQCIAVFPVQNCSGTGPEAFAGTGVRTQYELNSTGPGVCSNPNYEIYSFQMWEVCE